MSPARFIVTFTLGMGIAAVSCGEGELAGGGSTGGQPNRCASGLAECAGNCVRLTEDSAHCGACGHACELGKFCSAGACTCPPGLAVCGGGASGGGSGTGGGGTGGSGGGVTGPWPPTATFGNPVLWEDLADIDIFRVDDTFYYTASNMHYSPGAPILRSFDLVNWEYAGHAIPVLDFAPHYDMSGGAAYVSVL